MSKVCNRCVMNDASDKAIIFDKNGYCNYCSNAIREIGTTTYFPNEKGLEMWDTILQRIKTDGRDRRYDCVIGISGGLDSSYLAYLCSKWGLRALAIHINDGFDTEISKENIRRLVEKCGFDYKTITPDDKQYCALTKAYMKAGVPNLAVPQDNILFAYLYNEVRKNKIKYFLTGGNFALECILQQGNTHNAMDVINIKDIHNRFGEEPIDKLRFISSYQKYIDMKLCGLKTLRPLNYIDYNRDRAFEELKAFCGFEYYGAKHLENILTAFIQLYWLPRKFGVDKRTSHLSSMIVSGQMSRTAALEELSKPICDERLMSGYVEIVKKRLNITNEEFEDFMKAPAHQHDEYKAEVVAPVLHKILK